MAGFGVTHPPLVALAKSAITTFFRRIEVFGSENVPDEGPIIFACTHSNMAVDPAVLSNVIPSQYSLHYWVKDSLFKNPAMGALLRNAGNIGKSLISPCHTLLDQDGSVDRRNKNNQLLFLGTFKALQAGECVGVFPEGTSHTEPHLISPKDGTSWAALEYLRYLEGTPENGGKKKGKEAVVVPVSLCYTDKAKFRSRLVVHIGEAITMDDYRDQFLSEKEGDSRLAVKKLTRTLEMALWRHTVNAPDWETAYAAQMARELLWEKEDDLKLKNFVDVSQTLVDLFTTSSNARITSLRSLLYTYHHLLASSRLSNSSLIDLPLSPSLDPKAPISIPGRFTALYLFVRDTLVSLLLLPFFVVPLLIHIPIYAVGVLGGRMVEEELETIAQMKIAFGLLLSLLMYPALFGVFVVLLKSQKVGVLAGMGVAALGTWGVRRYHTAMIDYNYDSFKRLTTAWRLLIGLWIPSRFEYSLPRFLSRATLYAPDPPKIAGLPPSSTPEKYTKPKHLPSRVLVRHVLRTRLQAARELMDVLNEIEDKDQQVSSSFWLTSEYGEQMDRTEELRRDWEAPMPGVKGSRGGEEVVAYLKARGARVWTGTPRGKKDGEGHWATSGNDTEH